MLKVRDIVRTLTPVLVSDLTPVYSSELNYTIKSGERCIIEEIKDDMVILRTLRGMQIGEKDLNKRDFYLYVNKNEVELV